MQRTTSREVVRLFACLERAGKALADADTVYNKVELHDAAMTYARVVLKIARTGRS